MAVLRSTPVSLLLVLSCCNFAFVAHSAQSPSAIFAFGDSLTDTGNGVRTLNPTLTSAAFQPYGQTYFGHAADRYSDGRVPIDCIAESLGLSFVNPFFNFVETDFSNGVSYAIGGSTALDYATMAALGYSSSTPYTLEDQLQWHLTFLKYAEVGIEGVTRFPTMSAISQGLYFIAIGAIDLSHLVFLGKGTEMMKNVTQLIIVKITETVQVLYEHGARNFLLGSTVPMGCLPVSKYSSSGVELDDRGCLPGLNDVVRNYSISLAALSQSLSETLPNVSVAHLDIYSALDEIFTYPDQYGIVDTLNVCCGASATIPAGALINGFILTSPCAEEARVCDDPNSFMNWDGNHYTDNTVRQVVNMFIEGKFIMPSDGLSRFGAVTLAKAQMSKDVISHNSVIR